MRKVSAGCIRAAFCALLLIATVTSRGQDLKEAEELNKKVIELYEAGQYAEAVPVAQRALSIQEKALGPDHADLARLLENLAILYSAQDRYADAEPLAKRSLAIRETALGPEHPDLAPSLNNLALIYYHQDRYSAAEALIKGHC
jgi:tetratricopeptide (TPR) repeat protein